MKTLRIAIRGLWLVIRMGITILLHWPIAKAEDWLDRKLKTQQDEAEEIEALMKELP